MARCRRNVDNFLEACRKIGVDEVRNVSFRLVDLEEILLFFLAQDITLYA